VFAVALLFIPQETSSLTLPIGRTGHTTVQSGRLTDLRSAQPVTPDDIAKAADGKRFVLLGEQHATPPDQAMEASIIEALVHRGRHVVVGLEMYQRPKQAVLDQFSEGDLDETTFLSQSDWKGQWGFDFSFYRPVFDVIHRFRLPLVGLNVPRAWVHAVGQGGFANLPADARPELPADMRLDMADHRQVFDSLMGGHQATSSMDNMYAAQVLWDEAMADTAIRYQLAHHPDRRTVFVIIAGSGHVMYGQGINLRLARRNAGDSMSVVMAESTAPLEVSNGLADFVYVTPEPRKG
jgi:uncharacterized iron-regulated protein